MTWADIERKMRARLMILAGEWDCPLPERHQHFSSAAEAECSVWCEWLAHHFEAPLLAPAHIQPLILARVVTITAHAHIRAARNENIPQMPLADLLQFLFLTAWDKYLKERWEEGSIAFPA